MNEQKPPTKLDLVLTTAITLGLLWFALKVFGVL